MNGEIRKRTEFKDRRFLHLQTCMLVVGNRKEENSRNWLLPGSSSQYFTSFEVAQKRIPTHSILPPFGNRSVYLNNIIPKTNVDSLNFIKSDSDSCSIIVNNSLSDWLHSVLANKTIENVKSSPRTNDSINLVSDRQIYSLQINTTPMAI